MATGKDLANGWTIDPAFLETATDLARIREDVSDEEVEAVICVLLNSGYCEAAVSPEVVA
jgi:hypothetical protein